MLETPCPYCLGTGNEPTVEAPVLDKTGREITVGCYMAYGHALGRCAGIRIGKVLDLVEYKDNDGKQQAVITVIGVDDDWGTNKPRLCERTGNLLYPERTVVLPKKLMSAAHIKLLKDVTLESLRKGIKKK